MSTLVVSNISDGTNSTTSTNTIKGSAKVWINFNGAGTVATRASHNVSSLVDNAVGEYTLNFGIAMADANYAVVCGGRGFTSHPVGVVSVHPNSDPTASSLKVTAGTSGGVGAVGFVGDMFMISVSIFD